MLYICIMLDLRFKPTHFPAAAATRNSSVRGIAQQPIDRLEGHSGATLALMQQGHAMRVRKWAT